MTYRFSKSEELFERAKRSAPGGVHSPVRGFRGVGQAPRFIEKALGSTIVDVDGNRYVDFCMSWGPLLFGHADPEVKEAVLSALNRGWSYGAAEPYSLELAELITSELPWVEKIRFVSSGTEAVMSALRLARAATGRQKILKFDGCYHGHVDSMLVRAGSGLAEMASPDSAGVSASVAAETIVAPLNNQNALEEIFSVHGNQIAAVIVEPIPANNGLLVPEEWFLPTICNLAKKHGSLVIFDEVITGFRVAFGGMAERSGLHPDIVTYGKVIGGGFPIGAYGGRKEIMDLVAPVGPMYQAGTLSANPVAVSAGLAMLKKLKRENPYQMLEAQTQSLARKLENKCTNSQLSESWPGLKIKIQNFASLFWPIFLSEGQAFPVRSIEQIPSGQKEVFSKVFHNLLRQGFYLPPSGFEVGFLSTAHSAQELENFVEAFASSL